MLSIEKLSSLKKHLKSEDGFTFLEILVSLLLLSILGLILWSSLFNAQGLIGKILHEASFSAKVLQLDDFIVQAAQKIRVPFWVKEIEIQEEDGRMVVPWLNGNPEDFLVFQKQNDSILIGYQESGQFLSFGPFADIDVRPKENGNEQIWGVQLTITDIRNADHRVVISAHFGSAPFSGSGME